jgi:hypothetical protein
MRKRITITYDDELKPTDVLYYVMKTDIARCNHGENHAQMLTEFVNGICCCVETTKNDNLSCKVWRKKD